MAQREDQSAPARVATSPPLSGGGRAWRSEPATLYDALWAMVINNWGVGPAAADTAPVSVSAGEAVSKVEGTAEYVDNEAAMPLDKARPPKTTSAPRRRLTLHQLSFREHSEQNLTAVGRFDRLCLRFLKFVVARRALAFCLVTGFYVALAGAGIALGCLTPSPQYEYEWVIDDKRSTQNMDMRLAAVDAVDPLSSGDLHARKQPYTLLGTWVEYAEPDGHIFTPARLQEICEMEATFYRPAEYQEVCVLDEDGHCAIPPLSIVGQFYGDEWLAGLVRNGTGTCNLCWRRKRSRQHGEV